MATVQKRGDSYRIIVSCGYDSHGKQIRRSTTWTPSPGMTKNRRKKSWSGQRCFLRNSVKTALPEAI